MQNARLAGAKLSCLLRALGSKGRGTGDERAHMQAIDAAVAWLAAAIPTRCASASRRCLPCCPVHCSEFGLLAQPDTNTHAGLCMLGSGMYVAELHWAVGVAASVAAWPQLAAAWGSMQSTVHRGKVLQCSNSLGLMELQPPNAPGDLRSLQHNICICSSGDNQQIACSGSELLKHKSVHAQAGHTVQVQPDGAPDSLAGSQGAA